jgi:hypothetical protein
MKCEERFASKIASIPFIIGFNDEWKSMAGQGRNGGIVQQS